MTTRFGCDPLPSERKDHSGATSAPLVPAAHIAEAAEAGHLPAPAFATSRDHLDEALAIAVALGHLDPLQVVGFTINDDRVAEPERPLLNLIEESRAARNGRL